MALLEASGIGKNFGDTKVLKDISLTLKQGEALAIIGSSGSGKTTLLRCLNFLERPDTGCIRVNGETMWDAADPATQRESEIRKKRLHFGLVFQNFNLFPQYTALQNVMLASELLAKEQPDYRTHKKEIHAQTIFFGKVHFRVSPGFRKQCAGFVERVRAGYGFRHSEDISGAERYRRLCAFLDANPFITRKDYSGITGLLKNKALNDLNLLVEKGILTTLGQGSHKVYVRAVNQCVAE